MSVFELDPRTFTREGRVKRPPVRRRQAKPRARKVPGLLIYNLTVLALWILTAPYQAAARAWLHGLIG